MLFVVMIFNGYCIIVLNYFNEIKIIHRERDIMKIVGLCGINFRAAKREYIRVSRKVETSYVRFTSLDTFAKYFNIPKL